MAVIAPFSRFKRNNFIILIVVLFGAAAWMAYDGYLNRSWIAEHTLDNGQADSDLIINRVAPAVLAPLGLLVVVRFALVRNRQVVADDDGLTVGPRRIAYEAIEAIDKTFFDSKGYFVVSYRRDGGGMGKLKLSDRTYDHLPAVLDELVRRIAGPEAESADQAPSGAATSARGNPPDLSGPSDTPAGPNDPPQKNQANDPPGGTSA